MAIPAYLNPPDFLAAMRGGAEAGLGRARITQAADEAAARLSLGYAELGARERMSADENSARREHAADVLRERQSEFGIRQAEIAAKNAELSGNHREAQKIASAAQTLREDKFKWQKEQPAKKNEAAMPYLDRKLIDSAMSAKRQASLDLADPIKGAYGKDQLNRIISDADAVLQKFTPQAASPEPSAALNPSPTSRDASSGFIFDGTQPGNENAQRNAFMKAKSAPLEQPPLSTPPQGAVNEVVRKTKDGRTAIFDATTKQFLRYGD